MKIVKSVGRKQWAVGSSGFISNENFGFQFEKLKHNHMTIKILQCKIQLPTVKLPTPVRLTNFMKNVTQLPTANLKDCQLQLD